MVTLHENVTSHFDVFMVCLRCKQVTILEPGTITSGFGHRMHPGKISIETLVISAQYTSFCSLSAISLVFKSYLVKSASATWNAVVSIYGRYFLTPHFGKFTTKIVFF